MISIQHLRKEFGPTVAVNDVSFDVQQGEVFALLGGNGSGKTTIIRCLLGIYQATSGAATINGTVYHPGMSSLIGYLPEERGLYTTSKVLETMVYFGELKGMSRDAARQWSLEYLEEVGIADKANLKIQKLSSGQQQKVQLGITIINNPKLLILDEPTKGLDPVNRDLLMKILERLNAQGTTVVFITHYMDEVEKIADRLLMIKNGEQKLYGGVDEVRAQFGTNTLHLDFTGTVVESALYTIQHKEKNHAELHLADGVEPERVIKHLLDSGLRISSFRKDAPSLQDVFVRVSQNV